MRHVLLRRLSVSRNFSHSLPKMTCEEGRITLTNGAYIGYKKRKGDENKPGLIYCAGLLSNLNGTKARYLDEYCEKKGISYVRFDYIGHTYSSGSMDDFSISTWKQNTLDVFDQLTSGPQILIGSSMGGWISTLVAMERPERVHSLLTIANAADLLVPRLDPTSLKRIAMLFMFWCKSKTESTFQFVTGKSASRSEMSDEDGRHKEPSGTPPLSAIIDARWNSVLALDPIPIKCPVRLLHGMDDRTVPYHNSIDVASKMASDDVEVRLVKDADHRFCSNDNLCLITTILDEMLEKT